ncbi:hypothetical protein F4678DRAFT_408995 [Xylaria arbuscula]|nr:hypothetical protein F4678DRAFT_408995 [Xylaria arbuscula]
MPLYLLPILCRWGDLLEGSLSLPTSPTYFILICRSSPLQLHLTLNLPDLTFCSRQPQSVQPFFSRLHPPTAKQATTRTTARTVTDIHPTATTLLLACPQAGTDILPLPHILLLFVIVHFFGSVLFLTLPYFSIRPPDCLCETSTSYRNRFPLGLRSCPEVFVALLCIRSTASFHDDGSSVAASREPCTVPP